MKQKGIIIKSVDYGESDKIITILNEYGAKIPLMARRAKKVKSGLQANTQLFVYGLFIYNKWRGMGTLNSVDVINQHYELQLDLFESSYALRYLPCRPYHNQSQCSSPFQNQYQDGWLMQNARTQR